jgi:Cu-processing system ATP-binding protein
LAATIALEGVTKRYGGVVALRDVALTLAAGEATALVGHNGAGKTTLMKLVLGLIRPTVGSIRVLGADPVSGAFAVRRAVGFLPENVSFNAALTGRETLAFYARLKRQGAGAARALLERVGLDEAADRRVGGYSKGMRQRLGLAQALLGEPRVLLLDEPTTGLDPALRQTFYEIVEELRAGGATVLLSSHALTELEDKVGRVVIMHRGVKAADGTLDELRRLARLPTKIRLTLADADVASVARWLGPLDRWRRIDGNVVELDAQPDEKLALLRRIADRDAPVRDIEVASPGLDALYAHFLRGREAAP